MAAGLDEQIVDRAFAEMPFYRYRIPREFCLIG